MIRALLLPLAAAISSQAPLLEKRAPGDDFASGAEQAAGLPLVFSSTEGALDQARRSIENRLYPEAALALASIAEPSDERALLQAEADYGLARYENVIDALSDERFKGYATAEIYRAMAQARLGAFSAARETLYTAAAPDALKTEFLLLKAETAARLGDRAVAAETLRMTPAANSADARLLRAELAEDASASARQYRMLAAENIEPAASRAALALLLAERAAGERGDAAMLEALRALSLRWRGGAFEREALMAIGALARDQDPDTAFAAFRKVADFYPRSDDAEKARAELTAMLTTVLDRKNLFPADAARLFYENIAYAPPGAEGDALIRDVAARLAALDLLADAAELLEHQVFKRLRGAERAQVAADLAELYLEDRRASEALRVIRSTRITGLSDDIVARRRLIEARALDRAGGAAAALALLSGVEGSAALEIRADILWREAAFAAAGAAYRDLLRSAPTPFDAAARARALRAGAAFLKAGDEEAFAVFYDETKEALAGAPEGELLNALRDGAPSPAFLDAYRQLFGTQRAGG
ncbi:MAG: hypothetical protein AB7P23_07940 [Amphiplicatus sp.]